MKRSRKFLSFTSRERQLLLGTFFLLGLVRLGLWLLPFQTLRQILASISQTNPVGEQKYCPPTTDEIVWAVNLSSRYMPGGAKCLARALTTQVLMSRHSYSPQLRIGVAKGDGGQLEAHAWVESQGEIVIGHLRDLSRFTPLAVWQGG